MDKYPILKFFEFAHLPERLQEISRPFGELAQALAAKRPEGNAETAAALRKLLEAKDCAVRAALVMLLALTFTACGYKLPPLCVTPSGNSVQVGACGTPAATQGTPVPSPTVAPTLPPVPTVGPTFTPVPVATLPPVYIPPAPPIDMSTSGAAANVDKDTGAILSSFDVEITQHYQPQLWAAIPASGFVKAEIPQDAYFWSNPGAAKNCDGCTPGFEPLCGGHNSDSSGNRTIMWWVCGGSITYKTLPRSWDVARPGALFDVTCSPNLDCTGYPGRDAYQVHVKGSGAGWVKVCVPPGATTVDGIKVPVQNACGVWPTR